MTWKIFVQGLNEERKKRQLPRIILDLGFVITEGFESISVSDNWRT